MPDPISAAVVGGTALVGSKMQAKAAGKAADVQAAAAREGMSEEQRRFEDMRELLKPYTEAGIPALQQQQAFLGLKGPQEEQAAIERIRGGETFKALAEQGEQALLQRASATGGLRGGNIQGALAQYRPQLLSGLIEEQYGRLGGMTALGQRSAAGVGAAGMETGTNIANLLAQQASAQAGGEIGQARAYGQLLNMPAQFIGMQYGAGKTTGFGF